MIFNIHAGHNPDGMVACGAVGLIQESTQARVVKDKLIEILRNAGHIVYDCTCDNGTSQSDVLKRIVKKCNAHNVDLDVSIHFNSGVGDKNGNGSTTGTEVLVYDTNGLACIYGKSICNSISELGYKNRGIKVRPDLYVLNSTKAPALLIECCFVDDFDDIQKYRVDDMAEAIAKGLGVDINVVTKSRVIINGKEYTIERILKNGSNYVKIRDIATLLGYEVQNRGSIPVLKSK